jgi:hypothetical protein
MTNRIRIEIYGNPNMREFHVNAQISCEKVQSGIMGSTRDDPFRVMGFSRDKELAADTKATLMRFYDVDGVESTGLDIYCVRIERSPAFEWEEIESNIVEVIKELVNWADDEVVVEYLFLGKLYPDGVSREVYEAEMERQRLDELRYERMYGGL